MVQIIATPAGLFHVVDDADAGRVLYAGSSEAKAAAFALHHVHRECIDCHTDRALVDLDEHDVCTMCLLARTPPASS